MIKKISFIGILAVFLFLGYNAQASEVFSEPTSYIENGQKFYQIKVFLNTDGESVNALKGEMLYSPEELNFQKITDGSSVVNFWLKKPQKSADGKIIFSGGMPGGYNGEKGFIFSAIFSPKNDSPVNQIEVSFQNLKVYLNDGKGTEKNLADFQSALDTNKAMPVVAPVDSKPPEVFAPYVTRDPNLANGQWVVILNAQDKGEGIDHYEIFESSKKYDPKKILNDHSINWKPVADSKAYILEDQNLGSYVYAEAIDKSGNKRIAVVIPAINKKTSLFNYKIIFVIIILSVIALIVLLEIFFFRKKKYE